VSTQSIITDLQVAARTLGLQLVVAMPEPIAISKPRSQLCRNSAWVRSWWAPIPLSQWTGSGAVCAGLLHRPTSDLACDCRQRTIWLGAWTRSHPAARRRGGSKSYARAYW